MTKRKTATNYQKMLQGIIHQYIAETGITEIEFEAVVKWAHSKGLVDKPKSDPWKRLKEDFSRAARAEYITDENGEPVRKLHSYIVKNGEVQLTLWSDISDMNPEKWKVSMQLRRRGVRGGVLQCDRDNRYFNKNVNPGDSIEWDWNFNPDVAEDRMPKDYPETPPDQES